MTLAELAVAVLHTLDLQQRYSSSRSQTHLYEARDAERRLRAACTAILCPPVPLLPFDPEPPRRTGL